MKKKKGFSKLLQYIIVDSQALLAAEMALTVKDLSGTWMQIGEFFCCNSVLMQLVILSATQINVTTKIRLKI